MRAAVLAGLLATVLAASALDLAIGALWVTALAAIVALGWRRRAVAPLVVLASAAVLAAGARLGWLAPPPPAPYEAGWLPSLGRARSPGGVSTRERERGAARARLAAVAREELRLTGPELERRAGAAIELARRAGRLRERLPGEVQALDDAARRLARTLSAAEFRDLEARRTRVGEYLAEVGRRLARARDEAEMAAALRATDPAAMAPVSLRAVREDLARAGTAARNLLRALGVPEPGVDGTAAAVYEEPGGELRYEVRYTVTVEPPARLVRLDAGALPGWGPPSAPVEREYALDGEPPRALSGASRTEIEPGSRRLTLSARWREPAAVTPVRSSLRRIAFHRLEVRPVETGGDVLVTVAVGPEGPDRLDVTLAVPLPPARLGRLAVPAHALHWVSEPGATAADGEGEAWAAAPGGVPGPLVAELVPAGWPLRSAALARVRGRLYRANLATAAAVIGSAGLAVVLARRPRRPPA